MQNFLIKNGLIVNADDEKLEDLYIQDGKIHDIGVDLENKYSDYGLIDASGQYLFPGGIDPHVHFHLKTPFGYSADDFYTGSKAALAGGTTTFIDFVTPNKDQTLTNAFEERLIEAENSLIDYAFHASITSPKHLEINDFKECLQKHGFAGVKIYMAYKDAIGINDKLLLKTMQLLAKYEKPLMIHAENGDIIDFLREKFVKENKRTIKYHALSRPAYSEFDAVQRAIIYAQITGCELYFVHVSTNDAVNAIHVYKKKGGNVSLESCPQYFLLDDSLYEKHEKENLKYIFSPPLRSEANRLKMLTRLGEKKIDIFGTDHCPFNIEGQKDKGLHDFTQIPNGAGGVEFRMSLLYNFGVVGGLINLQDFVALTSTNAARIFKLKNKGALKVGFDADVVVWNPKATKEITKDNQYQNCDNNIYEGFSVQGVPDKVFSNGKLLFDNGKLNTNKTKGKHLNI